MSVDSKWFCGSWVFQRLLSPEPAPDGWHRKQINAKAQPAAVLAVGLHLGGFILLLPFL